MEADSRFRSFAERYLVARASSFRVGHEEEDGWKAILDAKTLYNMVDQVSRGVDKPDPTANPPGAQSSAHANALQGQAQHPYTGPVSYPVPRTKPAILAPKMRDIAASAPDPQTSAAWQWLSQAISKKGK